MRLNNLHIINTRNIADATLDFGNCGMVVVRGANHAGKSTIGQDISMLFTPVTEGLDGLGRGFIAKIRHGEQKAVIQGDVQGSVHTVRRTVTLNTNTVGREAKTVCIDDESWHPLPFENFLEYRKAALIVALNTDYFLLNLEEAKQKDLMARLVLPERHKFDADKVQATELAIGTGAINFDGDPMDVITKAYKKLYDARTDINRDIKNFSIPDPLPLDQSVNSKTMQAAVKEAQTKRRSIEQQRNEAIQRVSDSELKRARIEARIKGYEEKIREEQERLGRIEPDILTPAKLKTMKGLVEKKSELDSLTPERNELAVTIRTLESNAKRYRQQLEECPDAGSDCPTCGQPINLDALMAMNAKAIVDHKNALEKDHEILRKMQELGDISGAVLAVTKHEAAEESQKAVKGIIDDKRKLLKKDREELAGIPKVENSGSQFDQALLDADTEINQFMAELWPVIAAEERKAEIERKRTELAKMEAKAKTIDKLVKYFDKDGIKAELLKKYMGGFTEKINAVLAAWGYHCEFTIEPYEFRAGKSDSLRLTHVSQLSRSERLMFLAALQCAVSQVAELGIVVIDQVDTFLPEERGKLAYCVWKMLKEGYLEQAFLIVSETSTEVPELPEGPECRYFFVENGNVRLLGA